MNAYASLSLCCPYINLPQSSLDKNLICEFDSHSPFFGYWIKLVLLNAQLRFSFGSETWSGERTLEKTEGSSRGPGPHSWGLDDQNWWHIFQENICRCTGLKNRNTHKKILHNLVEVLRYEDDGTSHWFARHRACKGSESRTHPYKSPVLSLPSPAHHHVRDPHVL